MEPGYRLFQDQPRLQALLRGADGSPASGNGPAELPERIQGDTAGTDAPDPAHVEETPDDLCQFNERSVSQGCPDRIHREDLCGHEKGIVAYFSNTDEKV